MVRLRDMVEADIEDYVRWFCTDIGPDDWKRWDAPWESEETTEAAQRVLWTQSCARVQALSADAVRWRFEIEADGVHAGWVSAYDDLGYLENPDGLPAIGIDIPDVCRRGHGLGAQALRLFMCYWQQKGYQRLYTQTWLGNLPMLRLAQKLGFREYKRVREMRIVDGKRYDAITFVADL